MQKLNTQLLKKVSTKPKHTIKENIIFYTLSFATLYGLIYALCMVLTLINLITL
jgi:hypothetical protein